MNLISELQSYFNSNELFKVEKVQSLWSDYGEVARYFIPVKGDDVGGQSIIVKHVTLPEITAHPRGWNTSTSHQRKIHSYQNEGLFYANYANRCDSCCYVPKLLGTLVTREPYPLILEDLDAAGFDKRVVEPDIKQVYLGLGWLAYFHANFINVTADDLWPVGTYWHLSTRLDELEAMRSCDLKNAASTIDSLLNNASYQTLVHGDAKIANFCWRESASNIAAIDFQYVGRGVGIKDVMYFLGSCLSSAQLVEQGNKLLDTYFLFFQKALIHYRKPVDGAAIEQQWRELYPLVWADFHRFLLGWHPQHMKINGYMKMQTEKGLARL